MHYDTTIPERFVEAVDSAIPNAPKIGDTVATATPTQAVDRLAYIKTAIAALRDEEEFCKKVLVDSGLRAIESGFYRATVAEVAESTTTDWKALALSFKPSGQKLRAYTTTKAGYFRVDVRAKKTS